jgi:hypothetical protein
MSDFCLVPVDHQPSFPEFSLIPVDHDPFSAADTTQQTLTQPLATDAGPPNAGADIGDDANRSRPLALAAAGDSYPTADAAAVAALQDAYPP